MRRLHNLLRKTKRQISTLKKLVSGSDITIDQFEQTDKLDELLDEADYEAKLSDIYDMLIRQGLDAQTVSEVFDKITYEHATGLEQALLDEEAVMF